MSLKGFLVFQLFLAPLSLWLIIYLLFGQMSVGNAKIGLLEQENSLLAKLFSESAQVNRFGSEEGMLNKLEAGKLDMGIILSPGFDENVQSGKEGEMKIYISGSSQLQQRLQAFILLQKGVLLVQGKESVVHISTQPLGSDVIAPWYDRLLPLVVLIAVMMGGIFIPATSLIGDKQRKTLSALLVAPVNTYEIIWSKMLLGGFISFLMGFMILALNQSLSVNTAPLLAVLALVTMSASCFGCIIGYVSMDMKSVTTLTQSLMLLMYAPTILNIFPNIPGWVQKIFPTYYFFSPLLKLSDDSFRSSDAWELAVLFAVLVLLQVFLMLFIKNELHHTNQTVQL